MATEESEASTTNGFYSVRHSLLVTWARTVGGFELLNGFHASMSIKDFHRNLLETNTFACNPLVRVEPSGTDARNKAIVTRSKVNSTTPQRVEIMNMEHMEIECMGCRRQFEKYETTTV